MSWQGVGDSIDRLFPGGSRNANQHKRRASPAWEEGRMKKKTRKGSKPVDELEAALVLADLAIKLRLADLEIEALS